MTSIPDAAVAARSRSTRLGRLVGGLSVASGVAGLAWVVGIAPAGSSPDLWIGVWNILLVPVAVWLAAVLANDGRHESSRVAGAALISGAMGVASAWLWATARTRPDLEAIWIGLSAGWWIVTGALIVRRGVRWLGVLTLVLGAFALLDAVMTAAGVDGIAYLAAGPKLPLGWLWAFVVGLRLVVDPVLEPRRR